MLTRAALSILLLTTANWPIRLQKLLLVEEKLPTLEFQLNSANLLLVYRCHLEVCERVHRPYKK